MHRDALTARIAGGTYEFLHPTTLARAARRGADGAARRPYRSDFKNQSVNNWMPRSNFTVGW
jgi:hypothetical protein